MYTIVENLLNRVKAWGMYKYVAIDGDISHEFPISLTIVACAKCFYSLFVRTTGKQKAKD